MRNPTHIRPFTKRRIALLLFVTMLLQVILIFPSNISVSAEDADAILDDGIYTIDNVYLKNYYGVYGRYCVRVESGSVVLSTNTYGDVSDNLCRYWYFEHVENNQYRIRSMTDYSKALSASGNDVILTSASSATLWTVRANGYGYQLVCSSNTSNDMMSLIDAPTIQMHPMDSYYYYATSDVRVGQVADMAFDAWNVTAVTPYSFTVNHYYDRGSAARFTGIASDVRSYQSVCSEILYRLFGVSVSNTYQSYTSCADLCTGLPATLEKTKASCSCGDVGHKDRDNIMYDLASQFGNGTSIRTRVAWTGHVLDDNSSASYRNTNIIVMGLKNVTDGAHNNLNTNVVRSQRIITLLHELSHQLGAADHYCFNDIGEDGTCSNPREECWICDKKLNDEPFCMMSRKRPDDLEVILNNGTIDTLYCDQCMSSIHTYGILTHLDDHHS